MNKKQAEATWAYFISSFIATVIAVTVGCIVWVLWDILGLP